MSSLDLSLKTTHIGSLPLTDPEEAVKLSIDYLDIPAWPQLSKFKEEGMLVQFNEGFPGFDPEKEIINTASEKFESEMIQFYETYLQITEEKDLSALKNFSLSEKVARGFVAFLNALKDKKVPVVKGQITGPFTLAIALKTETGENPIFRDDLKDLIVKFLAIKALAQGLKLKEIAEKVIIFLDEPGLSGFGSSAFITVSKEDVINMLNEIFLLLKEYDIIPGIHVCANTSWDIVLDSEVDILNFDSFSYFDKFIIYSENLKKFFEKENKYIAWGVVPTDSENLENVDLEKVMEKFKTQLENLCTAINLPKEKILEKSLFTPACGLGSLKKEQAIKALNLLKEFKEKLKNGSI